MTKATKASPSLCVNCRYFCGTFAPNAAIETPEGFGECRRNAPVGPWRYGQIETGDGVGRTLQSIQSAFALVSQQDWCGQYIGRDGFAFTPPTHHADGANNEEDSI